MTAADPLVSSSRLQSTLLIGFKTLGIPGSSAPPPMTNGPNFGGHPLYHSFSEFARTVLVAGAPDPSSSLPLPPTVQPTQENPQVQGNPPTQEAITEEIASTQEEMAFLNIYPTSMLLPGYSRVVEQGRVPFIRMVTPRATPKNEDLAIVTVSPIPFGEVPFAELRNVILSLLVGRYGLQVKEIQKCPFGRGQAFVRLARVADRDSLVYHSLHHFQGLNSEFVNHNRGANSRRVNFNRECWLMLIGYPTDYRNTYEIEDTIKSFGRLLFWQRDNILARIIIKARVTDLTKVPHYIIISEGDDFERVSLIVSCEIIQQNPLGGLPQDEDIPPGGLDGNFIFPGLDPHDHDQPLLLTESVSYGTYPTESTGSTGSS